MRVIVCSIASGSFLDVEPPHSSFLARVGLPPVSQPGVSILATPDGAASSAGNTTSGAMQDEEGESPSKADSSKEQLSLPPLSLQLDLENLWSMLSECLDALERTYDPHAVLVLQPTVEAFFLVHGELNEDTKSNSSTERKTPQNPRSHRLPSFHTISDTDSNPGSPAPFVDLSPVPGTPSTMDMEGADPYAHLPPDTARFLKFAGERLSLVCLL